METPESILKDESSYKANAWREYSLSDLGHWVYLLTLRASHRSDADKRAKDLADAQAYLDMMQSHLNQLKG